MIVVWTALVLTVFQILSCRAFAYPAHQQGVGALSGLRMKGLKGYGGSYAYASWGSSYGSWKEKKAMKKASKRQDYLSHSDRGILQKSTPLQLNHQYQYGRRFSVTIYWSLWMELVRGMRQGNLQLHVHQNETSERILHTHTTFLSSSAVESAEARIPSYLSGSGKHASRLERDLLQSIRGISGRRIQSLY
jgi:hypothetical protein